MDFDSTQFTSLCLGLLIFYFTHVFLFLLVVVLPIEGKVLRCSDSRFGLRRLR
jgi:hypothetical protein